MNQLSQEKRIQILNLLVEGSSLRSISRIVGCSINTVTKLLVSAGKACQSFHNDAVKNLKTRRVQCDEIWSFVYAKDKNVPQEMKEGGKGKVGDVWTWVGMDADSKLVISWLVGDRGYETACVFMNDLASRLLNRVQLTTDGHKAYLEAVEGAFSGFVDYAMLQKIYGIDPAGEKRYSPSNCIGTEIRVIDGNPNPKHINTSYIERQNLTMRMHMKRFTRLTNAFSKKVENHCYAIALHYFYYNFMRLHKTHRVTPAMEAGISDRPVEFVTLVKLIEDFEKSSN